MKLVLFDIDGTLIHYRGIPGFPRIVHAIRQVYGVEASINPSKNYNGLIDRQIVWDFLSVSGIPETVFAEKWPLIPQALCDYANEQTRSGQMLYQPIPAAVRLVRTLSGNNEFMLGVMTGNVEQMARWKLSHVGLSDFFPFGVFSDGVEDRNGLARLAYDRYALLTGHAPEEHDIVVIGDTVHDIRCGKSIGADTIGVSNPDPVPTTHRSGVTTLEQLLAEEPTLAVESLGDPRVSSYFGFGVAA